MEGLESAFRFPVGCYNWFGSCQLCLLSSLGRGVLTLSFFFFLWLFLIYLLFICSLFLFLSHLFLICSSNICFAPLPTELALRDSVCEGQRTWGCRGRGGCGFGVIFLAIFSCGKRCILLFPPICYDVRLYIILVCPGRLVLSGLLYYGYPWPPFRSIVQSE